MFEVLYKNPATIERYRLAPRYSASYLLSDIGGTAVLVASFALGVDINTIRALPSPI